MTLDYPKWDIGAGQGVEEVLFGISALAAVIYCVVVARRERKLWPLFVAVGATLTVIYEPYVDFLAHVAWPEIGQHTVFNLFGRDIPLAACLIYVYYFAAPVTWLMLRFEAGITRRTLAKYYVVGVVLAAAFEPLFAHGDLLRWWHYYGENQPLAFTGLPMFWWFISPMTVIAVAAAFHLLRTRFLTSDAQTIVFIPGSTLVTFASHGSAGAPVFIAIFGGASEAVTTMAALMTIALSIAYTWLIARLVCVPAAATPAMIQAPAAPAAPSARPARPVGA